MPNTRALFMPLVMVATVSGCIQSPFGRSGDERPIDEPGFPEEGSDVEDRKSRPPPARLSLVVADRPPPPISGGTLSVTSDGSRVVGADSDRDAVYVVKVADGSVAKVALPAGSEPGRTVLDNAQHAHVILRSADAVVRISLASPAVAQQTKVCQHPRGLAYDAAADAIWVACASGELVSLAAATHAELSRTFVALDLRDVIVSKTGERFVSRYRSAELLHVANDGSVAATSRPEKVKSFASSRSGTVSMAPALAWRTVASRDGKPWMLHQQAQEDAVTVQPGGYGGGGGDCRAIAQPSITQYDLAGKPISTVAFSSPALSVDMAMSPDGKMIALATPGAYLDGFRGTVHVIQLSAVEATPSIEGAVRDAGARVFDAGGGADGGVALAPAPTVDATVPRTDGGFVAFDAGIRRPGHCPSPGWNEGFAEQSTAVAFDDRGYLYVLSREPARLTIYAPDGSGFGYRTEATIELSSTSVRDTGHELFHADVGAGLACASCHGEALDDGHVWTFEGFGPRRTQNMRGGLLSTQPLHWEGDMPTFQHLVDDVMTGRMGGFQVEPKYAEALANWIDAQPELKLAASDAAASKRGKALFESSAVACASCHSGEQLTNNESVDVGTGGIFQVPSLQGLGLRGPFMHDGCAKTLRDRFAPDCGGGDQHGNTSKLTEAQLSDLVAYLETL